MPVFVYIATPSEKMPALIPFDNISPLNNHSIKMITLACRSLPHFICFLIVRFIEYQQR